MEERAIDGGQLDGAIRDGRARLTCIRRIDGGHCARRPMAMLCRLLLVLLPRGICRHHRCPRRTTTCERREGERNGGGPTFLCKRVPGGRAWMELCQRECSRSRRLEELCLMCLMHRVCGRAQASTDGGRRAPFALGDDDERVTRGLRIEGLAEAAACALTRGSLSLIGCLHHRRAHGLLVPASDHARRGAR